MPWSDFSVLLVGMAIVAYACRALGFLAMRYVPMNGRMEAALKATPISVMSGIAALAAYNGGPAEWLAIAGVVALMRLTGHDIVAAFGGITIIALARAMGL